MIETVEQAVGEGERQLAFERRTIKMTSPSAAAWAVTDGPFAETKELIGGGARTPKDDAGSGPGSRRRG